MRILKPFAVQPRLWHSRQAYCIRVAVETSDLEVLCELAKPFLGQYWSAIWKCLQNVGYTCLRHSTLDFVAGKLETITP